MVGLFVQHVEEMKIMTFEGLYLGVFKVDNSYEGVLKRVRQHSCSAIAEELYHAHMVNDHKDRVVNSYKEDNQICNTKVSKLLDIVDGLIVALDSASSCILNHEHNDHALRSERFYLDTVVEETYELINKLEEGRD